MAGDVEKISGVEGEVRPGEGSLNQERWYGVEDDYVEGLTGEEIINDVLDQTESKLRGDCNLRGSDAYPGGYDGWVEVHLNLRGLDLAQVKTKIIVGAPAGADFSALDKDAVKETLVDVHVDIPLETRLNAVRERSGQDVPTLTKDDEGKIVVKKRHYTKRTVVSGTKETEELETA